MIHIRPVSDLRNKFTEIRLTEDVEHALDTADRMAEESDVRYTHDEVFSKLRGTLNG